MTFSVQGGEVYIGGLAAEDERMSCRCTSQRFDCATKADAEDLLCSICRDGCDCDAGVRPPARLGHMRKWMNVRQPTFQPDDMRLDG